MWLLWRVQEEGAAVYLERLGAFPSFIRILWYTREELAPGNYVAETADGESFNFTFVGGNQVDMDMDNAVRLGLILCEPDPPDLTL
jgi:hypothetical protein